MIPDRMTSLILEAPISGAKLEDHDATAEIKTHGATNNSYVKYNNQVSANLCRAVAGVSKHTFIHRCHFCQVIPAREDRARESRSLKTGPAHP